MVQPPLYSTIIDKKTTNAKNYIWNQVLRNRQNTKKNREKSMYQRIWSQTYHCQTHHQEKLIPTMTENTANLKSRDAIKRKSTRNTQNRTRQTHRRATLIRPTKVIIKSRYSIRRRAIGNMDLSNYARI